MKQSWIQRTIAIFGFASLWVLHGCNSGSSSPPPPEPTANFSANQTSFSTSQTLGEADVTQELRITNTGDASGSFSLTTTANWITLSASSGSLAAGSNQTVTATLSCSTAETRSGTISLTGGSSGTVQITMNHICNAPPIQITVVASPVASAGVYPDSAQGNFSFSISSPWEGQGSVDYTLIGDTISFEPESGSIEPGQTVDISMSRGCSQLGETTSTITIQIEAMQQELSWITTCTGNIVPRVTVEYFQGPRTAVVQHLPNNQAWQTQVQPSSLIIENRQIFVSLSIEHPVSDSPSILFTLTPSDTSPQIVRNLATNQSSDEDQLWITSTVLNVPAEEVSSEFGWQLTMSWNDTQSGSPLVFNWHELNASTVAEDEEIPDLKTGVLNVEPLHIKFVPVVTDGGTPDFDPSTYLTHPTDLLSVAVLTQEKDQILEVPGEDVILTDILLLLADRWFSTSLNPLEFFHGIVELGADSSESCGVAYAPGQVAVSEVPGDACDEYTVAHEFGHNLSLDHSPGCLAPDIDINFPYLDGTIGSEDGWVLSQESYVPGDVTYYDLMGYCNDRGSTFISRYHFKKAAKHSEGLRSFGISSIVSGPPRNSGTNEVTEQPSKALIITGKLDKYGTFKVFSMSTTDAKAPTANPAADLPYEFTISDAATGESISVQNFGLQEIMHSDEVHWFLMIDLPKLPLETEFSITDNQGAIYLQEDLNEKLEHLQENQIYIERGP